MRYVSKCIPKQMRLQPLPENVGTERRVSEFGRQRVPGHRAGDGKRPTAERAATMSWYDEVQAVGRSKSLTTGTIRRGVHGNSSWLMRYGEPCLRDTVNCHQPISLASWGHRVLPKSKVNPSARTLNPGDGKNYNFRLKSPFISETIWYRGSGCYGALTGSRRWIRDGWRDLRLTANVIGDPTTWTSRSVDRKWCGQSRAGKIKRSFFYKNCLGVYVFNVFIGF